MGNSKLDARLICLHPNDNVVVILRPLEAGDQVTIGTTVCVISNDLGLGHKIALKDIPACEQVLKCGVVIGNATASIRKGEHIHLHNLQSNYTKTHTREAGKS